MSKYSVIHRGQETVYRSRIIALAAYSHKVNTHPNANSKMLVDDVVVHEHKDPLLSLKAPYYIVETGDIKGFQNRDEAVMYFYSVQELAEIGCTDVRLVKIEEDKTMPTGTSERVIRTFHCATR